MFDYNSCIINPTATTEAACCHIGSGCGSPCDPDQYQCHITETLTASGTTTTSLAPACCPRACTATSMYRCPESMGGGCCSYGSVCGTGGRCLFTRPPPPPPSSSPSLTMAPPGCTTGQITCPATLGGGCCDATHSCTLVDDKPHCAPVTALPSGSGIGVVDAAGGLSPGATAGLSVGVVVGSGLLIGAATWWCLRQRRERRRQSEAGSSSYRPRPTGVVGRIVGGGTATSSGGGGGGGGNREMLMMTTEEGSDMMSRSGRLAGLPQDYFGPDPAIGPYSDALASAETTPGPELRDRGGVPVQPHGPGDIAAPVEIDSRLSVPHARPAGPGPNGSTGWPLAGQERFELYGSDPGRLLSPRLPTPPDDWSRRQTGGGP